ncbi:MAG: Bacterial ribosome SSU maturation protein RimP [uncultured Acidimicrobiales bacterium]|uniref:Ribosome maturation factor RimP n=1 Tax=uncultured Acidimicrobiales bacterium TaxID=310071 RepID=A0A6J4HLV3_9ACTN|nr:MAG: Bacterial ribosome SSU maturation protein RimP [uncultured Acidimicrobiales bacterium]
MSTVDTVRELIEPLMSADGLEVVEVEHGRGLLRITLDREGGIDLGAITDATERISDVLDLHDPIPGGRYTLEVSSPGVERPLRKPEHFERFVGTTINVKTHPHVAGERRIEGELTEADADGITVADRRLAYADIERARTVFEWGPTPKPGKGSSPKKAASR